MGTEGFGARIRRRRTELELGLRETAKRAKLSATFLSRVETGAEKAVPGEDAIRRLAEVLQENFDDLMAAAGKVSSEVTDYVKGSPGMPEFLRQAQGQNVSVEKLMELLEKAKDEN